MRVLAVCVVTPLLLSSIVCMLKYESEAGIKPKKKWRNFRFTASKRARSTTRRPTTTKRPGPGQFQWCPPTQMQKAPDWWNFYETPQPPHRYSKQSFSYDLDEIYKDYRRGTHNPTPRNRNECTVRAFYDSYGRVRTMKRLDKNYVEAFKNILHLDTNSYYCDFGYSDSEDNEYQEYTETRDMLKASRTKPKTRPSTTLKATRASGNTTHRTNGRQTTSKKKNTTHAKWRNLTKCGRFVTKASTLPMKWMLKITPVLEPEDKFYKTEEVTEATPHWGFLKTTGGNKTKRKYSYRLRPRTSPIKLIVVRQ